CRAGVPPREPMAPAEDSADARRASRTIGRGRLEPQGSRVGGPAGGGAAINGRVAAGNGPLRRILGPDGHTSATAKVATMRERLEATTATAPPPISPRPDHSAPDGRRIAPPYRRGPAPVPRRAHA